MSKESGWTCVEWEMEKLFALSEFDFSSGRVVVETVEDDSQAQSSRRVA